MIAEILEIVVEAASCIFGEQQGRLGRFIAFISLITLVAVIYAIYWMITKE